MHSSGHILSVARYFRDQRGRGCPGRRFTLIGGSRRSKGPPESNIERCAANWVTNNFICESILRFVVRGIWTNTFCYVIYFFWRFMVKHIRVPLCQQCFGKCWISLLCIWYLEALSIEMDIVNVLSLFRFFVAFLSVGNP